MKLKKVHSLEAIPEFAGEEEEVLVQAQGDDPAPGAGRGQEALRGRAHRLKKRLPQAVFRPEAGLLGRLKAMARRKGKGYQTLLKEFVLERLYEEEKREGVI